MDRSRSGFKPGRKGDVGEEVAEVSVSNVAYGCEPVILYVYTCAMLRYYQSVGVAGQN